MPRPLLLLDVDGVLMPLGRSVPPGFQRHTTDTSDVVVSAQHAAWLRDLAESFDLVWASTWGLQANDSVGKALGLPYLPAVPLAALRRDGTRKLTDVAEFVAQRPAAWVDDELYEDADAWAQQRKEPTLLIRTAPYLGLRAEHVDLLKDFAASLVQ